MSNHSSTQTGDVVSKVFSEATGGAQQGRFATPTPFQFPERWLCWLILACGLFTVLVGAKQILSAISTVPFGDEWSEIDAVAMAPNHWPPVSWLWSQHNEHRVVFYRLLLLADIHVFRGHHWIYFWCMLAVQAASLVVFLRLISFGALPGAISRTMAGFGAFCLFCPTQWENFGWAFQISFLLPTFFLFLSLLCLLGYLKFVQTGRTGRIYIGASILAACAATYSNANGVLVWPILVLAALVLGTGLRVVAAYAVMGLLLISTYLYHYASPPHHSSPLQSISHPLSVLAYSAGYLGLILPPWVRFRNALAIATGTCGLTLAMIAIAYAWRSRRAKPLSVALAGVLLFTLMTSFVTALGRVGFGIDQAFQSRYQTFNLLFWLSNIASWLIISNAMIPWLKNILLVILPLGMLAAITQFPVVLRAPRIITLRAEAGAMALITDVPDRRAWKMVFPRPEEIVRDMTFVREQRLFMFSGPLYDQIGQPLSAFYQPRSDETCTGKADVLMRVPVEDSLTGRDARGLRATGWATYGSASHPVPELIITVDGRIAGFAVGGLQVETSGTRTFLRNPNFDEWFGSARIGADAKLIELYGIGQHGQRDVCLLARSAAPSN